MDINRDEGAYGIVIFKDNNAEKILKNIRTKDDLVSAYREIFVSKFANHPNLIGLQNIKIDFDKKKRKIKELVLIFKKFGKTLMDFRSRIKRNAPINKLIKTIMFQIFRGVGYLHQNKIIHRDLHIKNILVDLKTLNVKIIDFGKSKEFNQNNKNTYQCHERYFKSPEQIKTILYGSCDKSVKKSKKKDNVNYLLGKRDSDAVLDVSTRPLEKLVSNMNPDYVLRDYDLKSDIFSIGQVFFYLATEKYFYQESKNLKPIFKILQKIKIKKDINKLKASYNKFEIIKKINNKILDEQGKDLMIKCLQLNPDKRLTAIEALKHPYLSELNEDIDGMMAKYKEIPKYDLKEKEKTYQDLVNELFKIKKS
jgi:serine/threonine protein kinase